MIARKLHVWRDVWFELISDGRRATARLVPEPPPEIQHQALDEESSVYRIDPDVLLWLRLQGAVKDEE